MADARALLRQQREARRITHPHAFYSDAGKLLCTVCREVVKAEGLWNSHINGEGHQARLKQLQDASAPDEIEPPADGTTASKRKHPSGEEGTDNDETEDGVRRKRSKADMGTPFVPGSGAASIDNPTNPIPPSGHGRLPSGAPAQGVEINIPSRPATPATYRDQSSSLTSVNGPSPQTPNAAVVTMLSRKQTGDSTTMSVTSAPAPDTTTAAAAAGESGEVDENEWAAFEADIAAASAEYDEGAVVSAPAMTTEEATAAQNKKDGGGVTGEQRVSGEKVLLEEREDAARAFEDELEEMEALEQRFRKLKDKREALRRGSEVDTNVEIEAKEDVQQAPIIPDEGEDQDEDDEDDDDEDEDDWNGFRFQR